MSFSYHWNGFLVSFGKMFFTHFVDIFFLRLSRDSLEALLRLSWGFDRGDGLKNEIVQIRIDLWPMLQSLSNRNLQL